MSKDEVILTNPTVSNAATFLASYFGCAPNDSEDDVAETIVIEVQNDVTER